MKVQKWSLEILYYFDYKFKEPGKESNGMYRTERRWIVEHARVGGEIISLRDSA